VSLRLLDDQGLKEVLRKNLALAEKLHKFLVTAHCERNQWGDRGFKGQETNKASVCITQIAQLKLLKIMHLIDIQINIKYWERLHYLN